MKLIAYSSVNVSLILISFLIGGCSSQKPASADQLQKIEKRVQTLELNLSDTNFKVDSLYKRDNISVSDKQLIEKISELEAQIRNLNQTIEILRSSQNHSNFQKKEIAIDKNQEKVSETEVGLLYKRGRNFYVNGKLKEAEDIFSKILQKFPQDKLAANAQYWIGEIYYDKEDYVGAIEEFQKVIDFYITSSKAPDAQLKIGLCYKKLGKDSQAKIELERIIKDYPNYDKMYLIKQILKDM